MRARSCLIVLAACLLLAAPSSALPITDLVEELLDVDQAEPAPCVLRVDPVCLAWRDDGPTDDIGDDTYYFDQHIERILGRVPLPIQQTLDSLADLENGSVPIPIFQWYNMVDEKVDDTLPPWLLNYFDLDIDEDGIHPRYPDLTDDGRFGPATRHWGWADEVINYTHAHLPYTTRQRSTDYVIHELAELLRACPLRFTAGNATCLPAMVPDAVDSLRDVLPNFVNGAQVDQVQVTVGGFVEASSGPLFEFARFDGDVAPEVEPEAAPSEAATWNPGVSGFSPPRRDPPIPPSEAGPAPVHALTVAASPPSSGPPVGAIAALVALVVIPAFAWWLYTRITGLRAFEHPTRKAIHAFVQKHPGCDVAMVATAFGLSYKTARHHVAVLRRAGFVGLERDARRLLVFLPADQAAARRVAALRHPARAAILRVVESSPGIRQVDAAQRVGVTRSTLHGHVEVMRRAGLVRSEQGRLHVVPGSGAAVPWEHGSMVATVSLAAAPTAPNE